MKWMAENCTVLSMDMTKRIIPVDYPHYTPGILTNTPMRWHTHGRTQPEAVVHTDVAEMAVPLLGGARHFVTFSGKACVHVKAYHMKSESSSAELLKRDG